MCSLPLKSVLKADALHLDRIVEVKNRSHDSTSGSISSLSHEADWPVVGLLKVTGWVLFGLIFVTYHRMTDFDSPVYGIVEKSKGNVFNLLYMLAC